VLNNMRAGFLFWVLLIIVNTILVVIDIYINEIGLAIFSGIVLLACVILLFLEIYSGPIV
jgi:membrane-bound ClpP family serine protease